MKPVRLEAERDDQDDPPPAPAPTAFDLVRDGVIACPLCKGPARRGSDWFACSNNCDETTALALLGAVGIKSYTLREYLQRKIPKPVPLLGNVVVEGEITWLWSWRGLAKTWLTMSAAVAVASGTDLLIWKAPRPRKTLLIDGEMAPYDIGERLARLAKSSMADAVADNLRIVSAMDQDDEPLEPLDTPRGQEQVEPLVEQADAIFIDNRGTLFEAREMDGSDWGRAQSWLLSLRRRGKAVFVNDHAGKGGELFGTSLVERIVNTSLKLSRPPDYRAQDGARVLVEYRKGRSIHGEGVEPFEAWLQKDERGCEVWTHKGAAALLKAQALEQLNLGISPAEVLGDAGGGIARPTLYRWINEWLESGELKHDPRPRKSRK